MAIAWGEWKPDVSSYDGDSTENINNVFPRGDGYGPIASLSPWTGALPAACRGGFLALRSDGTVALLAGTATKLYLLDNTSLTWTDVSKASAVELDYTGSTNIGDLTTGGGLAAAFDTTTAQAAAACANKAAATTAYVGKTLASNAAITSVNIYGSNDAGYVSAINPTVTATLYGKTGAAPANGTDGTILGTISFTDTADEHVARTITSTNVALWTHVWVYFTQNGAANQINVAEVDFFSTASYSVGSSAQWQFVQSGSDVIALNANDAPQRYTLGTSTSFANLAGSPPQAAFGTMINEYLVLSGLSSTPYRIAWSATGDITGWTAGTNGSDVQDFADGGVCRGIAGGEFGWLFQDNCIRRMVFVGGTTQFQFTRLTEDLGLRAPYSLTRAADRVYFLARSGFQELTDGGQITPIGKEKFDRTFFTNWDSSAPHMLIGAHDPESSRVLWFYKSTTGTAGIFDKGIVYDWNIQRAAPITGITGEFIVPLAEPGTTLDALDALGFTSIDAMTISLDSIAGSAGAQLSLFDTSHKAGFLSGSFLEATMETASQGSPQRTFVRGARPITDAPTVYGSVLYSQRLGDTATQSTEQLMNAVGFTPHRADGHMVRYRNRIPAGTSWTYSAGVEPDSSPTGLR